MSKQLGFLVNMEECYGCKTCAMACKVENDTSEGVFWRQVSSFITEDPHSIVYLSYSCNHCENPKCIEVCPTGAYSKRDDGIVVQDHSRCIGCKMCIMACPYDAPQYDKSKGKSSKCGFCSDRLDNGLQPRCIESCPGQVLKFGVLEDLIKMSGEQRNIELRYGLADGKYTNPSIVVIPPKRQ